jgi:hypothetical protein
VVALSSKSRSRTRRAQPRCGSLRKKLASEARYHGLVLTPFFVVVSEHRLSFDFFDLCDRELTIDPVWCKADAVAGFHGVEHRRITRTEYHGHALVHVELSEWAMLNRDLPGRLVHFGNLAIYELIRLRLRSDTHREKEGGYKQTEATSFAHVALVRVTSQ